MIGREEREERDAQTETELKQKQLISFTTRGAANSKIPDFKSG